MIINGNQKRAIEIVSWLRHDHGLHWPSDYNWFMEPYSNHTRIVFEFKEKNYETLLALRYG